MRNPSRRRPPGFSLVLVLAMIVLVTIAVLALFSQAQLQLRSTTASAAGAEVELLARNAVEMIVSDLRAEMLAGSDYAPRVGGNLLMRPATNFSLVPSRVVPLGLAADPNFINLIKQSRSGSPTYSKSAAVFPQSASYPPALRAVASSTSEASGNHRAIMPERWNAAGLVMFPGFTATNQTPDWVVFTQGGVLDGAAAWKPDFARRASGNPEQIIGRVAYNIYAIGGLLDANAAGFPGSLSVADRERIGGTLAGVDLSQIAGGVVSPAQAAALVTWRDISSDYASYVEGTALTNGFRDPHSGLNRMFAGRRDLVKFADDHNLAHALPYLTHFSREKNSPAAAPRNNASDLGGANGAGNLYAYRDNALATNSVNPALSFVRHDSPGTVTSYRDDGTSFTYETEAGEPLLRKRFSLSRLKWLGTAGPANGGTGAAILACFGLRWNSAGESWEYLAADASGAIKSLREVKAEGREPNFFELLHAGILAGSLGRDNEGYFLNGVADTSIPHQFQSNRALQVYTIGANIIDQWDGNSFPTVLQVPFAGATIRISGSESLPYLLAFKEVSGASPDNAAAHSCYLLASLWNPYQEEVTPGAGEIPKVRLRVQGGYQQDCAWCPTAGPAAALFTVRVGQVNASLELDKAKQASFSLPTPLTTANTVGSGGGVGSWAALPAIAGYAPPLVGLRYPDVAIDPARETTVQNASTAQNSLRPQYLVTYEGLPSDPFVAALEAQTPGGKWIPYCFSSGIDDAATWKHSKTSWTGGSRVRPNPALAEKPNPWSDAGTDPQLRTGPHRYKADPRSSRFNEILYSGGYPDSTPFVFQSIDHVETSPTLAMQQTPALFSQPDNVNAVWSPASLAFNSGLSAAASYAGLDGIRRLADYGRFAAGSWSDTAFAAANRPIILNRPFRSVSELAMAFRDEPWKSLDFNTAESGDVALLDLFSLADEPEVRAGVLDLNASPPAVLEAVVGDAGVAAAIADFAAAAPLTSRAELALLADQIFTPLEKVQRERPLRRLSEVGQVRTWNLLVDMVVQAVRYPGQAAGFKEAVVEAERHYWLSLAIDRYTGEVVDQILEPAYVR